MHLQAKAAPQRSEAQRADELQSQSQPRPAAVFADDRPGAFALDQLSEALNGSQQVASQRKLATALNAGSRMLAQRNPIATIGESPAQSSGETIEADMSSQLAAEHAQSAHAPPSMAPLSVAQPLQMMRRNPPRNAPRSWWSGFSERMSAGADTTSALTGVLTGGAVTAIAAANAWNPLGWGLAAGIGAGVLGTGLMSYLRGPDNLQRDSDRRLGLEDYDENADRDWTPGDVARRHIDRAQRGETNYPLETKAHEWDGGSYRTDTGAGMMTYHRGRGGQMYIRTRETDFGGQKVKDDYDSLVSALSHDDPEVEEERAYNLLMLSQGEDVDVSQEPNRIRRAMTFLLGMTQVAEENPLRSPGSAGTARSGFRNIADGTSTFHQEFNRADGRYVPAHVGGTEQMREVVRGTRPLDDDLAGNMSDDET